MKLAATSLALTLAVLARETPARSFVPNHLFVTCPNENVVLELDEDLGFVRTLSAPSLAIPHALAFGPNGLLYVGSANGRVFEFDGGGDSLRDFDVGDGPSALAFGPNGLLYATGTEFVRAFDVTQNPPIHRLLVDLDVELDGFAFGADGNLFIAVGGSPAVRRFDPAGFVAGGIDDTVFPNTLQNPQDVAMGPNGRIWVSDLSGDKLMEFAGNGLSLGDVPLPGFKQPDGIAFGPREELWITSSQAGKVARLDPVTKSFSIASFEALGVTRTADLAWSPIVQFGKVAGKLVDDAGVTHLIDELVSISYAPGSRSISILFADGPSETDLASMFLAPAWVLHGFERGGPTDPKRTLELLQLGPSVAGLGAARAKLQAKGILSENGVYLPKKLKGALSRWNPFASFEGTLKTKLIQS